MFAVYDRWPEIALDSYNPHESLDFGKKINHIIFAGMGGSGVIGDIFSAILSKENIHVCVVKGFHLPKTVDSDALVVTTSVSGNTVETMTILDNAKKNGAKVAGFSGGGKVEKFCNKNKIAYRKIPTFHSPRASFTSYLYSMMGFLDSVVPIKKSEILDSIKKLEGLQRNISSYNLTSKNKSLELASWISGTTMIYYPWGLQAAAIRFKNSLQENAKFHAMAEDVIEACHNGIVAWEKRSSTKPILLEGTDDYYMTKKLWKILKHYFDEKKIGYKEVFTTHGGILSKLVNLIYLLDYSTIYRAVMSKTDPTPIRSIEYVKKRMSQ